MLRGRLELFRSGCEKNVMFQVSLLNVCSFVCANREQQKKFQAM
jgi:hypothetical protein